MEVNKRPRASDPSLQSPQWSSSHRDTTSSLGLQRGAPAFKLQSTGSPMLELCAVPPTPNMLGPSIQNIPELPPKTMFLFQTHDCKTVHANFNSPKMAILENGSLKQTKAT